LIPGGGKGRTGEPILTTEYLSHIPACKARYFVFSYLSTSRGKTRRQESGVIRTTIRFSREKAQEAQKGRPAAWPTGRGYYPFELLADFFGVEMGVVLFIENQ
jgi:hypothetical protein